jgi:hypothetical protein
MPLPKTIKIFSKVFTLKARIRKLAGNKEFHDVAFS